MAGASSGFPMVDVHYLGLFSPNPLLYFHGEMKKIRDVSLAAMSWQEFRALLTTMTECTLERLYYCPATQQLSKGLNALQSECDYNDFIECAYGGNGVVKVYIDFMQEPVFEWIAVEEPCTDDEAEENSEENLEEEMEEDVDVEYEDNEEPDHAKDTFELPSRGNGRGLGDKFLNKLCPIEPEDSVPCKVPTKVVYPVHDSTKNWKEMEPVLGMKFACPDELKFLLSNYAVHYGKDLYFDKMTKTEFLLDAPKIKNQSAPLDFGPLG